MSIAPGWYADPQNAAQLRWWDGTVWTPQAMPRPPAAPASPSPAGFPAAPAYPVAPPRSFFARNLYSMIACGVAVLYGVLAIFAHVVFLGVFPIVLTISAFRAKEPYAVVALVVSIAAIGFGIYSFAR